MTGGKIIKRILKWAGFGLAGIVGIALVAVAYIWFAAGAIIDREYPQPETTFVADPDLADIEEGRRLALLRGCFDGCHGDGVGGNVFNDDFIFGRIIAPDLSRAFAELTDREIDLAVRQGIRRDGKSMMVMPSASFSPLSDADLNDITVFIRSHAPGEGPSLERRMGPGARFFLWRGMFRPEAEIVASDAVPLIGADGPHAKGQYLAVTVCGECHGLDLRGRQGFSPSLALTVAYSREDFGRLMHEGKAIGDRELGLMAEVARGRFTHMTDEEIEALWSYLRTLASEAT